MKQTRLKLDHCPSCGKELDAASSASEEAVPSPKDISICLYCGSVNVFQDDLKLRKITSEEYTELPGHTREAIEGCVKAIKARSAS